MTANAGSAKPVPQPAPNLEVGNMTGQERAFQDETINLFVTFTRKGVVRETPCCVFHKGGQRRAGVKCPFVHLSKDDRAPRPKTSTKTRASRGLKRVRKRDESSRKTPCKTPKFIKKVSMLKETSSVKEQKESTNKVHWSDCERR